jgi:D-glycero-alpha-D-manno-heptose-7-phosphate kinase
MERMKALKRIHAKAPTRIDLAGGTVDIWPIYLFLDRATTINLAIDLFAETELLETAGGEGGQVLLRAEDQGAELSFAWDAIDAISPPPTLELHWKYLRFFLDRKKKAGKFDPNTGLTLSTRAKSPAGAGLGGSSTLSVSIIGALKTWCDGSVSIETDGERLVEITRDVETTVIKVPAGMQDYYGAMFGGLQSLRWGAGKHDRASLAGTDASFLAGLERRLMLFYSGQSRNSGINNWALFKAFIDGQGSVRDQFAGINSSARSLESAIASKDWNAIGKAIASEWSVRRGLAQGITTPEIDEAFRVATENGATAGKICGAGGGGCFFAYIPEADENRRRVIEEKISALPGIRSLPFKAVPHGLQVEVSERS